MNASKKRRRQSQSKSTSKMPEKAALHAKDKHEVFTEYALSRGVVIGSVKPAALPGRGTGLIVTAPITKGERILFIPEKAMFKPNAALLKKTGLNKTAMSHAQLAMSLTAALTAEDTPLQIWEATWPTFQDTKASMPHFWDQDLLELLPPSVYTRLELQNVDFQKDSDHAVVSRWLSEDSVRSASWPYYWYQVNSRCFHFKPPGSKPGFMVLCPFIDYLNHGPSGSGCVVVQSPEGYEVTADRDYEPGEELLATYGAHSNEKLLIQYGFVCQGNDGPSVDDDIRLDHLILPHLEHETRQQLQDAGYLGKYALIPATNEICFRTQVAVRSVLLTADECEYFVINGDDLSIDHSSKVRAWLKPMIEEYHSTAVKTLRKIDTHSSTNNAGLSLLQARWTQIRDGLAIFLSGER